MCDPFTLTLAAVQTVGTVQQGKAQQRAANDQAAMDEYQARASRAEAEFEAKTIRRAGRVARGETLGALAASGVVIGEGSALEVERQVMTDYETDAAMAILSGERSARGLEIQATQRRRAGRDARNASYFNAAGSLLSAGSQAMRQRQAPAPVETRTWPTLPGRG
jgi:hypothetical protein